MAFNAIVENCDLTINVISNFLNANKDSYNQYFKNVLQEKLDELRIQMLMDETFLYDGAEVIVGARFYPYAFHIRKDGMSCFRIYLAKKISTNYPIYIKVSAEYLHTHSIERMFKDIEYHINEIFVTLDPKHEINEFLYKLTRLDICNHNNEMNIDTYIDPKDYNSRVVTRIGKSGKYNTKVHSVTELIGEYGQRVPYYRYGSGSLVVRFYNKIQEVVEQRYKSFFIPKWLEIGLIDKKTFNIYDLTYKLNYDYNLDFVYAHLLYEYENGSRIDKPTYKEIIKIYKDENLTIQSKYDKLEEIRRQYRIRKVKEIVNVEFQVRSEFLRTLRLINNETGEVIDNNNVKEVFECIDQIYEYLTTKCFRVVDKKSKAARKRDKTTDPIWIKVQQSKVENIKEQDTTKHIIYRDYRKNASEDDCIKKLSNNLARYIYLKAKEIKKETVYEKDMRNAILNGLKSDLEKNETYDYLKEKIIKQIRYYGEKED